MSTRNYLVKSLLLLIGFLLTLNVVLLVMHPAVAQAEVSVQYKVVATGDTQQALQSTLDAQGKDGWVLVTHYGSRNGDVLIFKK